MLDCAKDFVILLSLALCIIHKQLPQSSVMQVISFSLASLKKLPYSSKDIAFKWIFDDYISHIVGQVFLHSSHYHIDV